MNLKNIPNTELLNELNTRLNSDEFLHMNEYRELKEEIRLLSAQIRECEKGKSFFLSNVRNEINNPLTSILGLAASIENISTEEKVKRFADMILGQAFELDFQMRNIIIASEIESGVIQPLISQVNIGALIKSQVESLALKIRNANINVDVQVSDLLLFPTDAYLLQTICSNLLANAIEYSGNNKWVQVKATIEEDKLALHVIDYGIGIAREKQNLLFKWFNQLDSGSTKLHAGHGLGLAIVHELVGILGGSINLNSSANTGTNITIQLPLPEMNKLNAVSSNGNEIIFNDAREF